MPCPLWWGKHGEICIFGGRWPACGYKKGATRVKWVKRIVITLVVVFAFFYMVTRPDDAANAVQGAVGAVWGGVQSVGQFFTSLAT